MLVVQASIVNQHLFSRQRPLRKMHMLVDHINELIESVLL
jgi:hypothetical protein